MKILEQFTWSQFLLVSLAAIAIYYMFVIIRYKIDVGKLFKPRTRQSHHDVDPDDETAVQTEQPETGNEIMDELEELVDQIRIRILEAGNGKPKHEILTEIISSVSNFSGLHLPAYRYALNNYIIENSSVLCGIDFSEQELEDAWEALIRK